MRDARYLLITAVVLTTVGCMPSRPSGATRVGSVPTVALQQQTITPPVAPQAVTDEEIPYLRLVRGAEREPFSTSQFRRGLAVPAEDAASETPDGEPGAQDTGTALTVGDVRYFALQGNLDLAVISIDPTIAATGISEAWGAFEPSLSTTFSHRRLDPPPGNNTYGSPPDTALNTFQPAVNFPLVSGGAVRLENGSFRTSIADDDDPAVRDADYGVSLVQPLLRGAGSQVNTAPIRIAAIGSGIAKAQTRFNATLVLAEVERVYWRLFAAKETLRITEEQLRLAARQLGAATRLSEAGILAEVETIRAESGVQLRADAYLRAQTDVKILERTLRRIMQHPSKPITDTTPLAIATAPSPQRLEFDREQLIAQALIQRFDLIELQLRTEAQNVEIGIQRNAVLPQLQFEFYSRLLGTGNSHSAARRQAFGGDFDDTLFGISTELPLRGNISGQARLRRAKLTLGQLDVTREQLELAITQQVLDALDRLDQNWERILAASRAVAATRRAYEAEIRLFERGQRTGDLVLDAAEQLATSQIQEAQALAEYETSKVDLAESLGSLLDHSNIVWSPEEPAGRQQPAAQPLSSESELQ